MRPAELPIVPILRGVSNWVEWHTSFEALAMYEKVWLAVETPLPDDPSATLLAKDEKAKGLIRLNVSSSLRTTITLDEDLRRLSAHELWNHLRNKFDARSAKLKPVMTNILDKAIGKMKFPDTKVLSEIETHINQMDSLFTQKVSLGQVLDDAEKGQKLLSQLPESYQSLKSSIFNANNVSWEALSLHLQCDAMTMDSSMIPQPDAPKEGNPNPNHARGNGNGGNRNGGNGNGGGNRNHGNGGGKKKDDDRNNTICAFCMKPGHQAAKCFKRKRELRALSAGSSGANNDTSDERPQKKAKKKNLNFLGSMTASNLKPVSSGEQSAMARYSRIFEEIQAAKQHSNSSDQVRSQPPQSKANEANDDNSPSGDAAFHLRGSKPPTTGERDRIGRERTSSPERCSIRMIVDSGCTGGHMVGSKYLQYTHEFENFNDEITLGDGSKIYSTGIGSLYCYHKEADTLATLDDVMVVPNIGDRAFFSVSTAASNGMKTKFSRNTVYIYRKLPNYQRMTVAIGKRNKDNDQYIVEFDISAMPILLNSLNSATAEDELEHDQLPADSITPVLAPGSRSNAAPMIIWHRRMAHLNNRDLQSLRDHGIATGMRVIGSSKRHGYCSACIEGKATKLPYNKKKQKHSHRYAAAPCFRIANDLTGPTNTEATDGERYIQVIIDEYSRYVFVYCIKTKDEAAANLKTTIAQMNTVHSPRFKVKYLSVDGGGEIISKDVLKFLNEQGIQIEKTAPESSNQNAIVERVIRTITEAANTLLRQCGAPTRFWREAVYLATFCRNRSPSKGTKGVTPYQLWFGQVPDLSFLRTFGCLAYKVQTKNQRRRDINTDVKFGPRATKCVYLGYSRNTKGYVLYDIENNKLIDGARDVAFDETVFPFAELAISDPLFNETDQILEAHDESYCPSDSETDSYESEDDSDDSKSDSTADHEPPQKRPRRHRRAPDPGFMVQCSLVKRHPTRRATRPTCALYSGCTNGTNAKDRKAHKTAKTAFKIPEPKSVAEALSGKYRDEWLAALLSELTSLEENQTWELTDLPSGKKPIKCRWVFKVKYNADGTVERFKCRLVAQGFTQRQGIDYDETFAPVAKHASFRSLMAIAAKEDLELKHLDIRTAYLNGLIDKDIYMTQPPGFKSKSKATKDKVCKLKRCIYGLRQSGARWYTTLKSFLNEIGFESTPTDPCLFKRTETDGTTNYILIYVDDVILAGPNCSVLAEITSAFERRFRKIHDLGDLKWFLGVKVTRDRILKRIYLQQDQYTIDTLEMFNMSDCTVRKSPELSGIQLTSDMSPKTPDDIKEMESKPYAALVGRLNYLAILTRPDIAHAVQQLCQFMHNPGKLHWRAAKEVLRYLKGTINYGICYGKSGESTSAFYQSGPTNTDLSIYADADWANDIDDRKSIGGYVFFLNGGPIDWSSSKLTDTALSSTAAEYYAACKAVTNSQWLRNLLSAFEIDIPKPFIIFEDNQSCIRYTENPFGKTRMKHLPLRHFYLREQVQRGEIKLTHVNTKENLADIFTKGLDAKSFTRQRDMLNICDLQS